MKQISIFVVLAIFAAAPAMAQTPPTPPVPPDALTPPVPPMNWNDWGKGSYLGIGVQEIDAARAKDLKLPEESGVEVTAVVEDSPAAKAGLKEHDAVLQFNGERVAGVEQFVRMVRQTPPGRQVKLLIRRGGADQTIAVTLAKRDFPREMQRFGEQMGRQFGPGSKFQRDMEKLQEELGSHDWQIPDMPEGPMGWRSTTSGIEAESLSGQLAGFFGVKQGVLVRAVTKGSAAEKAGIQAGDVITKVGATDVTRPNEVSRLIRQTESGGTVPVTVFRNKQQLTLSVTPGPKPARSRGTGHIHRQPLQRHDFVPGRLVTM
jgi:serine protease Do